MSTIEKIAKVIMVALTIGLCYVSYELYKIEQKLNELEKMECNIK